MEPVTATVTLPAIPTDPFEAVLVLQDPQPLEGGFLRFSVVLCKLNGTRLITFKGWRVGKGALIPPASRHKASFISLMDLSSKVNDLFTLMLATTWKDLCPGVEFPMPDEGEPLGASK